MFNGIENDMRKIPIAILCLVGILITARAEDVPVDKAKMVAENFFGLSTKSSAGEELILEWQAGGAATKGDTRPLLYVFTDKADSRFVIVSGEDSVEPILGYSTEGGFNSDDIPENMAWWLSELQNGICHMRDNGYEADADVAAEWQAYLSGNVMPQTKSLATEKLLETAKWNQEEPYNRKMPLLDDGTLAYTGCTITALAIMMRYYKWPDKGTGYLESYEYEDDNGIIRQIPGHSIEDHVYDWDNMPLSYKQYTEEQADEISRLMYDLAIMLQAEFNSDGTAGNLLRAITGAINHMSYYPSMCLLPRAEYTYSQWRNMMLDCINSDNPIIYSGRSENVGHAFIVDGYDEFGKFHINWGWGGNHDGYFSLPNFRGYKFAHRACFGFTRYQGSAPVDIMALWESYEECGLRIVDDVVVEQGVPFRVSFGGIYNEGTSEFSGEVALMTVDRNGEIKEILDVPIDTEGLKSNYGWHSRTTDDCVITLPIEIGDKLKLFYRSDSNPDEWRPVIAWDEYVVKEIPIADQFYIEEVTDFEYVKEEELIIMNTKKDALVEFLDEAGNNVTDALTFIDGEIRIQASKLASGQYTLKLSKQSDVKVLEINIGGNRNEDIEKDI